MTPAEISTAKGGDVFEFSYANCDVADTQVFNSDNWGLYLAEGVSVGEVVAPDLDVDGVTSLDGKITFSVTLYHLDAFASSHVEWIGEGVIVEYALDGETWLPLAQNGVVALSGDPDFDIRVTFAGGVENDTANLSLLRVYVLKTDNISSFKRARTVTFSADPIVDGKLVIDAPVQLSAGLMAIQTVELWAELTPTSTIPGGTAYTDGVLGLPTTGLHHVVVVLADPNTAGLSIGSNMTISHLAVYPNAMTAAEVAMLYQGGLKFRVDDTAGPTVTEDSPAVDIYAYAWSVVSGSHA